MARAEGELWLGDSGNAGERILGWDTDQRN